MNQTKKSMPIADGGGHETSDETSDARFEKNSGHKLRNDILFVAGLLLIICIAGLLFLLLRGEGDTVTVTVDGKTFGTYALAENRTVEIRTGEDGGELNLLVIEDGKAYVKTATCPDGICAAHKPISRDGESIVCLPHKVVITVRTAGDADEPDIIA